MARESLPFKSLEELYEKLDDLSVWPEIVELRESTEYVFKGSEVSSGKLNLEKVYRDEQPRTLICHDMKGGYLHDRFIDGSDSQNSYIFYHWSVIDTFVYFSHYFVTIPPYGWINAAHTHGVKVLGTVITENIGIWDTILETQESTRKFAEALVHLAKFYKFEGWLLNVENTVRETDLDNLIYFVSYLTERMHEEIEGSEVIWYDSVTNKGVLEWQNELNDKNKEFFLNCDGIYLNYNWTDSRLASSSICAKNHKRNVKDIYVGLDVWGRGCPGGGGFNSAHALEKIRAQGLSAAIFAPGWTHEYFGSSTFHDLEDIFWAQLIPYLYIHVPIYDNETFKSSFCRGTGATYYRSGKVEVKFVERNGLLEQASFYNLTMQKPQITIPAPHLQFTHKIEKSKITDEEKQTKEIVECIYETSNNILRISGKIANLQPKLPPPNINYFEFCDTFSYEGGGCLKVITKNPEMYHRLFLVHIDFARSIQASIVYDDTTRTSFQYGAQNEPTLVLTNSSGRKSFRPCESSMINDGWKKCIYVTNMKSVNEVGVSFPRECECYLGEIVLEQKQRRYGKCCC